MSTKILWSVIVPTAGRPSSLERALSSLCMQSLEPDSYEILVVNNGEGDTESDAVVTAIGQRYPGHKIRLLHATPPGLLSGRHVGAREAQAEILTFVDDDIVATKKFASHILKTFADPEVQLVGGRSLPEFETSPPKWFDNYWYFEGDTKRCPSLSLLDYGDSPKEISASLVWGLNFSIRKDTLFKAGGFFPDGVPDKFLLFRGSGESGLARKISNLGMKIFYNPEILVYHIIPKKRLTIEYLKKRFFAQGISDSYAQTRNNGDFSNEVPVPRKITESDKTNIYDAVHNAYVDGWFFHQMAIRKSKILLEWVKKDNYWDYQYPQLESGLDFQRLWCEELIKNPLKALNDVSLVLQLALNYAKQGKMAESVHAVASVEKVYPTLAEAKAVRALVLKYAGRTEDSELAYTEYLTLMNKEKNIQTSRGVGATKKLADLYDYGFYREDGDGSMTSARLVLPYVLNLLHPESVQDFGCGQGDWLRTCLDLGVKLVRGYDANSLSQDELFINSEDIQQNCDFSSNTFSAKMKSDLAISVEVAEHLPESAASNFVRILTNASQCILFSAALPCQTGVHHINEQNLSYWNHHFMKYGYKLFDVIRPRIIYKNEISWWYRQNIVLFISFEYLDKHQKIKETLNRMKQFYPFTPVAEYTLSNLCKSHNAIKEIDKLICFYLEKNKPTSFIAKIIDILKTSGDYKSLMINSRFKN